VAKDHQVDRVSSGRSSVSRRLSTDKLSLVVYASCVRYPDVVNGLAKLPDERCASTVDMRSSA